MGATTRRRPLTDEQWLALIRFARWRGVQWRSCLCHAWAHDKYNLDPTLQYLATVITPMEVHKIVFPKGLI